MYLYRISKKEYARDLSGTGASMYGGRWNPKGIYMVYTSINPAVCMLECLVHISNMQFARDLVLITLSLPDNLIFGKITEDMLSPDWRLSPPPDHLSIIGKKFVQDGKYLGLEIPSVIVPEMNNILLNARHSQMDEVHIADIRPLVIDKRLFQ